MLSRPAAIKCPCGIPLGKRGERGFGVWMLVSRKVELRMQDSVVWNVVTVTSQLNGDWTADSYFSLSSVIELAFIPLRYRYRHFKTLLGQQKERYSCQLSI